MHVHIPERFNIAVELLDRNVERGGGGKVAIRCQGRAVTYEELLSMTSRVGGALRTLGVEIEDRVLLLLRDSPEFAAAYLGVMRIGAVAIPTNTTLRGSDVAYFLDESRAKVCILDASLWPDVASALADRPYLRYAITVGERREGCLFWDELLSTADGCAPVDTHRDDEAFWLWTAGSTGRPKAARHTHQDWVYCCEGYARGVLDIRPDDVVFSAAKAFHAYGLGGGTVFPLYAGATTIYYPDRPTPSAILETAEREKPSLFFAVPTLYAAMLADGEKTYDLSSVRYCVSAGEPLPPETYRRWRERYGLEILDGIGSTEMLHIYLSARPGDARPGSTGRPVEGYEVRIVDEDGGEVGPGVVGDLLVRGGSMALGYWHRRELSRDRMRGEWFVTGDKFYVDEDGYYWYAGRADDMFKVSGEWVSPIAIENVLIAHPAVLEAAVVPWQDEEGLIKPKAYVVLQQGWQPAPELAAELQAWVKSRLPGYCCPRGIEFVRELPKTAAGKIQRFRLRAGNGGNEAL